MNTRLVSSIAAAFLSILEMVSVARAQEPPPGAPFANFPFPFIFNFDENGHGAIAIWQTTTNAYGPFTPLDAVFTYPFPFLGWQLPYFVVPGDVSFAEPPSTACTNEADCRDGLRFVTAGSVSFMFLYSEDTGFPLDFDFLTWQQSADAGNGFMYAAGPGVFLPPDTPLNNYYNFVSGAVPELSTWR
jgi:hypothetical protein